MPDFSNFNFHIDMILSVSKFITVLLSLWFLFLFFYYSETWETYTKGEDNNIISNFLILRIDRFSKLV